MRADQLRRVGRGQSGPLQERCQHCRRNHHLVVRPSRVAPDQVEREARRLGQARWVARAHRIQHAHVSKVPRESGWVRGPARTKEVGGRVLHVHVEECAIARHVLLNMLRLCCRPRARTRRRVPGGRHDASQQHGSKDDLDAIAPRTALHVPAQRRVREVRKGREAVEEELELDAGPHSAVGLPPPKNRPAAVEPKPPCIFSVADASAGVGRCPI